MQKNHKQQQKERAYLLLEDILTSRKKLLEEKSGNPVRTPMCVLKMERKSVRRQRDIEARVAKRYFKEMRVIGREVGERVDNVEKDTFFPGKDPFYTYHILKYLIFCE